MASFAKVPSHLFFFLFFHKRSEASIKKVTKLEYSRGPGLKSGTKNVMEVKKIQPHTLISPLKLPDNLNDSNFLDILRILDSYLEQNQSFKNSIEFQNFHLL